MYRYSNIDGKSLNYIMWKGVQRDAYRDYICKEDNVKNENSYRG